MNLVARQLEQIFESGAHVRIQNPIAADDHSEPEPDIAVVAGDILDYLDAHPTSALLVVEISDQSLNCDRTVKQRLYARSGIPEYRILAIPESRLEVYREPHGDHYASASRHVRGPARRPTPCGTTPPASPRPCARPSWSPASTTRSRPRTLASSAAPTSSAGT